MQVSFIGTNLMPKYGWNLSKVQYLVSNDLNHDADHLYEIYQKRWQIEVYHKSHIPHQIAYKNSFSKRPQYFLCETEKFSSY